MTEIYLTRHPHQIYTAHAQRSAFYFSMSHIFLLRVRIVLVKCIGYACTVDIKKVNGYYLQYETFYGIDFQNAVANAKANVMTSTTI